MSQHMYREQIFVDADTRRRISDMANRMRTSRSAAARALVERGLDAEQILAHVRDTFGTPSGANSERDKKTFSLLREVLWIAALNATQGDSERAKKLFNAALSRAEGEAQ